MTPDDAAKREALVYVEQEDARKFRIKSDQLAAIGEQLRGPRQFSVFNSIVLPLIVSVATILFSTLFQYVSWLNSVRLQNATSNAEKASATYEKAAAAIGQRSYATVVLGPSARNLMRPKSDADNAMLKFDGDLNAARLKTYYEILKAWNEGYDQLLTDIDYDLDRPAFLQAEWSREGVTVFSEDLGKIDCKRSMLDQFSKHEQKNSLKVHFAGIHYCFMRINREFDDRKSKVMSTPSSTFDPAILDQISKDMGDIHTRANEFRCFALRRIDYYKRQKERSILGPTFLIRSMFHSQMREALEHFAQTEDRCKTLTRTAGQAN